MAVTWEPSRRRRCVSWGLAPGNRQTLRHREGLRDTAQTLDRRAHLRLAGPMQPPRQGFRKPLPDGPGFIAPRNDPPRAPQNRKELEIRGNFADGLLRPPRRQCNWSGVRGLFVGESYIKLNRGVSNMIILVLIAIRIRPVGNYVYIYVFDNMAFLVFVQY